jgi:hypothetical protein
MWDDFDSEVKIDRAERTLLERALEVCVHPQHFVGFRETELLRQEAEREMWGAYGYDLETLMLHECFEPEPQQPAPSCADNDTATTTTKPMSAPVPTSPAVQERLERRADEQAALIESLSGRVKELENKLGEQALTLRDYELFMASLDGRFRKQDDKINAVLTTRQDVCDLRKAHLKCTDSLKLRVRKLEKALAHGDAESAEAEDGEITAKQELQAKLAAATADTAKSMLLLEGKANDALAMRQELLELKQKTAEDRLGLQEKLDEALRSRQELLELRRTSELRFAALARKLVKGAEEEEEEKKKKKPKHQHRHKHHA